MQLSSKDPAESLALSAPEVNAYENQSGGVIEMLDNVLNKFINGRDEKSEFKAQTIKAKADATGDLQDSTSTCDEVFSVVSHPGLPGCRQNRPCVWWGVCVCSLSVQN